MTSCSSWRSRDEDDRDRAKYMAARGWVDAVNRDGKHGRWAFEVVREPTEAAALVDRAAENGRLGW